MSSYYPEEQVSEYTDQNGEDVIELAGIDIDGLAEVSQYSPSGNEEIAVDGLAGLGNVEEYTMSGLGASSFSKIPGRVAASTPGARKMIPALPGGKRLPTFTKMVAKKATPPSAIKSGSLPSALKAAGAPANVINKAEPLFNDPKAFAQVAKKLDVAAQVHERRASALLATLGAATMPSKAQAAARGFVAAKAAAQRARSTKSGIITALKTNAKSVQASRSGMPGTAANLKVRSSKVIAATRQFAKTPIKVAIPAIAVPPRPASQPPAMAPKPMVAEIQSMPPARNTGPLQRGPTRYTIRAATLAGLDNWFTDKASELFSKAKAAGSSVVSAVKGKAEEVIYGKDQKTGLTASQQSKMKWPAPVTVAEQASQNAANIWEKVGAQNQAAGLIPPMTAAEKEAAERRGRGENPPGLTAQQQQQMQYQQQAQPSSGGGMKIPLLIGAAAAGALLLKSKLS